MSPGQRGASPHRAQVAALGHDLELALGSALGWRKELMLRNFAATKLIRNWGEVLTRSKGPASAVAFFRGRRG